MLNELTDVLVKYDIDYSSYLIIQDIYYGQSIFSKYFLANENKSARTNIERGTLSNIYTLLNTGLIQKPKEINSDVILNKSLDKYYKNFKLTDKSIKIISEVEKIINNINKISTSKNNNKIVSKTCEEWIDEYRYLWSINNRPLKLNALGNRKMCIEKMNDFLKVHLDYDKELIINATKRYIEDYLTQYPNDNTYLVTAPYFIERKRNAPGYNNSLETNTMRLEDYCELIKKQDIGTNQTIITNEQGELA